MGPVEPAVDIDEVPPPPAYLRGCAIAAIVASLLVAVGAGAVLLGFVELSQKTTLPDEVPEPGPDFLLPPETVVQNRLRTALTAAMTLFTDGGFFVDDPARLAEAEPSIKWTHGAPVAPEHVQIVVRETSLGPRTRAVLATWSGEARRCYFTRVDTSSEASAEFASTEARSPEQCDAVPLQDLASAPEGPWHPSPDEGWRERG